MKKAFLYPIISNLKQGHFVWIADQLKKFIILKYLNKILPRKITVGPTMAILLVTYRCNSRCLMCDLPKRFINSKQKEFTTSQWKRIIDQLADIKTGGIGFTGGEPLVRTDIFDLISYAKSKGLSTTLNTNGILLNTKNIKKVLDINLDNINISLDGTKAQTYDFIRGVQNGFERVIKNVSQLVKERNKRKSTTRITFSVCVSRHNIDEIEKIADLAKKIGIDKIGFLPLHKITGEKITCFDNKKSVGDKFKKSLDKIIQNKTITVDNSKEYLKIFPNAFKGKKFPIPCLAGNTIITIDSLGNLFYCWQYVELNKPIFKISKNKKLKELWFSKEYENLRDNFSTCQSCYWSCHHELSIFYK